jgi:hypothetical protein
VESIDRARTRRRTSAGTSVLLEELIDRHATEFLDRIAAEAAVNRTFADLVAMADFGDICRSLRTGFSPRCGSLPSATTSQAQRDVRRRLSLG